MAQPRVEPSRIETVQSSDRGALDVLHVEVGPYRQQVQELRRKFKKEKTSRLDAAHAMVSRVLQADDNILQNLEREITHYDGEPTPPSITSITTTSVFPATGRSICTTRPVLRSNNQASSPPGFDRYSRMIIIGEDVLHGEFWIYTERLRQCSGIFKTLGRKAEDVAALVVYLRFFEPEEVNFALTWINGELSESDVAETLESEGILFKINIGILAHILELEALQVKVLAHLYFLLIDSRKYFLSSDAKNYIWLRSLRDDPIRSLVAKSSYLQTFVLSFSSYSDVFTNDAECANLEIVMQLRFPTWIDSLYWLIYLNTDFTKMDDESPRYTLEAGLDAYKSYDLEKQYVDWLESFYPDYEDMDAWHANFPEVNIEQYLLRESQTTYLQKIGDFRKSNWDEFHYLLDTVWESQAIKDEDISRDLHLETILTLLVEAGLSTLDQIGGLAWPTLLEHLATDEISEERDLSVLGDSDEIEDLWWTSYAAGAREVLQKPGSLVATSKRRKKRSTVVRDAAPGLDAPDKQLQIKDSIKAVSATTSDKRKPLSALSTNIQPTKKLRNESTACIAFATDKGRKVEIDRALLLHASPTIARVVNNKEKLKGYTTKVYKFEYLERFSERLGKDLLFDWIDMGLGNAAGVISIASELKAVKIREDGIAAVKYYASTNTVLPEDMRELFAAAPTIKALQVPVIAAVHWRNANTSKASLGSICRGDQLLMETINAQWKKLDNLPLEQHPWAGKAWVLA